MTEKFRFTVGSDPEHEDLVGDLYYDDRIVCILTQEEGFDSLKISFFADPNGEGFTFPLVDFEKSLGELKKRMWELRRGDGY